MYQEQTASKPNSGLLILLCFFITSVQAQTTFFPFGSTWRYSDVGSNLGTGWRALAFNDATWKSGPGQLGYGEGDEATVVSYGKDPSNRFITTYFRKTISITGKNKYASFRIEYKRDDGVVIYVNGKEVKRDNMPAGTITYKTLAPKAAADDGVTVQSVTVSTSLVAEGKNVIAVELHQCTKNNTDLSFDMRFSGKLLPPVIADTITRGPYLQMVNQNAITIRWATNKPNDSRVRFGTTVGNLGTAVSNASLTTEHEIRLTGLTADTKYFYSVGTGTTVLEETNKNFFNTAPPATTSRKIRIAAYGDCGNNSANQVNVKNAYLNYMGTNTTDLWLLLGDNAYNYGFANEYQSNFFNVYKNDLLKNMPLFPSPGNHDYENEPARQDDHNIPYYSFFTLPKNGECGGLPSNKEEYYSFDYGDIHFISLDSYGEEQDKRFYDTTGPQALWLKNDLLANTRKWTIAYWHHPPYSMGHNSDVEPELVAVRTNLVRILERNGVDLILNGHSHSYERSYLLHDHFGLENTFSFAANAVSTSTGRYDNTSNSCPYTSTAAKTKHGTVYVVAGSAGQLGGTQPGFPHAAMYYSNATTGGSLVLEIEGNRLDAKFVASDKTIKDQFTILKDVNKSSVVSLNSGESRILTASWIGNYIWSTGATTRSITISAAVAGSVDYFVNDNTEAGGRCLSDTFHVNVAPAITGARAGRAGATPEEMTGTFSFKIFPNPAKNGTINLLITRASSEIVRYIVQDTNGKIIRDRNIPAARGITRVELNLPKGMYVLKVNDLKGVLKTQKVLVQ